MIKFRVEQESDIGLANCLAEATKNKSDYVFHRDTHILFHRARYRDRSYLQVVVPTCHRTRVVSMAHDDAGHWSFKKTLQILRPNYFWPNMRKDVENYVKSCEACQRQARVTVARLKGDLRIANEIASSTALVRQEAYVHQHNLRARDKSFEEGDQVLILFGDSPSKLHSRWQGPGVVQSRVSTNKYLVSLGDGGTRIFHANHL